MIYQALYRKYRPVSFDDVISQPHVTETLKKEIISGKTAHAYIFTGSRGTGKTTCARILAKALICENPKNGEPCLECDICRDMENGRLSDIIEIDAASNNSVNDARELREAAAYTPERCRYRIYIIDEVHMLSPDAFNALLKIIEEPPEHVKFIMATTEIHKVLPTILSRCQRFDFKRIRSEDIAQRLLYVAEKEGFTMDSEAAQLIASAADGGMRDALSLLDRCAAFSQSITPETVSEAVGLSGNGAVIDIAEALVNKDAAKALEIIAEMHERSKDIAQLFTEIIKQLRNIMMIQNVGDPKGLVNGTPDELERLCDIAKNADEQQVIFASDELGRRTESFGRSLDKRTELEMAVITICKNKRPAADSAEVTELKRKIAELENKLSVLQTEGVPAKTSQRSAVAPRDSVTDLSRMDKNSVKPLAEWSEILEKFGSVCPSMQGTLHGSQGYESGDILLIVTDNNFFLQLLRVRENAVLLTKTIYEVTGKKYILRAKCTSSAASQQQDTSKLDALMKKAAEENIPIETVDS